MPNIVHVTLRDPESAGPAQRPLRPSIYPPLVLSHKATRIPSTFSMPIVELVFGPTPEAFQANPADPALVKPAYDGILKQDGAIKAYYGLKSEDSSIAYGFYVWESLEHHQKFMNNKAEYQPVLDAVSVMFDLSRLTMVHIKTSVEPYAALEAPLLEVATCTLHPGRSIEELESVLNKLVDIANTDKSPISPVLATSGRVVENEHTMMFLVGWPSDQAHAQWFETTPRAAELSDQLHQIAELDTIDTVQTLYY